MPYMRSEVFCMVLSKQISKSILFSVGMNIGLLWKPFSGGNYDQMKSFITSMKINETTDLKTYN